MAQQVAVDIKGGDDRSNRSGGVNRLEAEGSEAGVAGVVGGAGGDDHDFRAVEGTGFGGVGDQAVDGIGWVEGEGVSECGAAQGDAVDRDGDVGASGDGETAGVETVLRVIDAGEGHDRSGLVDRDDDGLVGLGAVVGGAGGVTGRVGAERGEGMGDVTCSKGDGGGPMAFVIDDSGAEDGGTFEDGDGAADFTGAGNGVAQQVAVDIKGGDDRSSDEFRE